MNPPRTHPTTFRAELTDLLMTLWEPMQDSAMNCVLSFDGQLDAERLRRAMRLTIDAEPILGCRFVERWYRPVWQRRLDLDQLEILRLSTHENASTVERFLEETLDADRDCQVRAELIRGAQDTLCIKFSHRIGDGQAFKQYVGLLAETYNRLADDPGHRPAYDPGTNRSLLQIAPRDRARRREIRRHTHEHKSWLNDAGHWKPVLGSGRSEPAVYIRRLDARRFASLFKHACGLRVTTFHLLVGALFVAARGLLPYSAGATLPLWCVVDLRRFGGVRDRLALCNLFGLIHVWLPTDRTAGLAEIAVQVREQVMLKQKRLGLTAPPFRLESGPVVRFAMRCLPYRWMKSLVGQRLSGLEAGICMLTDIGPLDETQLAFRGTATTGAYMASGMVRDARVLLLCVSQFRDTLTICSSAPRALPVDELLKHMLDALPAQLQETRRDDL